MERHWHGVQGWLGDLLAERGVDRISAEELTVPPGMDELFSLLQIKRHHEEGRFDCVIVDCAPTGETLRLLSFPDVVTWWLERILPSQRKLAPFARTLFDVPLPGDGVFEDVERLARNLVAMNGILRDRALHQRPARDQPRPHGGQGGDADLHLPEPLRLSHRRDRGEPRAARGGLGGLLRGLARRAGQAAWSSSARRSSRCRSSQAPLFEREVAGPEMLDRLAGAVFGGVDPSEVLHAELAQELVTDNGRATLSLPLPLATREELELKKIGLEVIVKVGGQKRTILLPPALSAYATSGARFADGRLEIVFEKGTR